MHMTQTSCHPADLLDLHDNTRPQSPLAEPTPNAQRMKQIQGHQWNMLVLLPGMVYTPVFSFPTTAASFLSFRSKLKSQTFREASHDYPVQILQPHSLLILSCSIMFFPFMVRIIVSNYAFVCSLFIIFPTTHSINKQRLSAHYTPGETAFIILRYPY